MILNDNPRRKRSMGALFTAMFTRFLVFIGKARLGV